MALDCIFLHQIEAQHLYRKLQNPTCWPVKNIHQIGQINLLQREGSLLVLFSYTHKDQSVHKLLLPVLTGNNSLLANTYEEFDEVSPMCVKQIERQVAHSGTQQQFLLCIGGICIEIETNTAQA